MGLRQQEQGGLGSEGPSKAVVQQSSPKDLKGAHTRGGSLLSPVVTLSLRAKGGLPRPRVAGGRGPERWLPPRPPMAPPPMKGPKQQEQGCVGPKADKVLKQQEQGCLRSQRRRPRGSRSRAARGRGEGTWQLEQGCQVAAATTAQRQVNDARRA